MSERIRGSYDDALYKSSYTTTTTTWPNPMWSISSKEDQIKKPHMDSGTVLHPDSFVDFSAV